MHSLFSRLRSLRNVPIWARYVIATMIVLVVFALRRAFGSALPSYPLLLFYPVIVFCAVFLDRGSSFLAVALSALLTAYFILEPVGSLSRAGDVSALVVFVVTGCMTAAL